MTAASVATGISLLPYLQSRAAGISLQLVSGQAKSAEGEFPFALIEPSNPFADILNAQVVIDNRQALNELFLLVQADRYRMTPSELWPVTNSDIEQLWQQAVTRSRPLADSAMPLAWPSQVDGRGVPLAFDPLFYCQHVQAFCRPRCPFCGGVLALCRDDRLLHTAGLAAYSQSLERYLQCANCQTVASEEALFYTLTLPADPAPRLRGCQDLIEAFSRLLTKTDLAGDLPCIGCNEATNCFGPQSLAVRRMVPIRFYPFFMMVQPAPALNALDYLALLSGAHLTQVVQGLGGQQKTGRLRKLQQIEPCLSAGSGLLFARDERRFLETLYLKLSFLHELYVLIGDGFRPANEWGGRISLEEIWVRLADEKARLPVLWNFALQLADPVGQPCKPEIGTDLTQAFQRHFLGTAWFYVLGVNASQGMQDVHTALETLLKDDAGEAVFAQASAAEAVHPAFAPQQIFWQAGPITMAPQWQSLWCRALDLGLALLKAGVRDDAEGWDEAFIEKLDHLKNEIRQLLFQRPAAPVAVSPRSASSAGQQIATILETLLHRWPAHDPPKSDADPQGAVETLPGMRPREEGDFKTTVTLPPQDFAGQDRPKPPDADQTVIVPPATPSAALADLEKTVIIGPPRAAPPDLDKTVLINAQSQPSDEDDLAETVILRSPVSGGASTQTPPAPQTADSRHQTPDKAPDSAPKPTDDLEATMVMRSDAAKNRKPKP